MKHLTALFLLLSTCSYSQTDTIDWDKRFTNETGLSSIKNSKDSLYFRFKTQTQVVDVWTNDYKTFNGKLVSHIHQDSVTGPNFKLEKELDTLTAKNVYNLFTANNVFNIPTQDSFPTWQGWFCMGELYVIEHSTPKGYSSKYYQNPGSQYNIKEAAIIDTVAKQLNVIVKMDAAWGEFIDTLPAGGVYTHNNASKFVKYRYTPKKRKKRN